jgi:Flp pilus assembly protein TadG
MRRLLRDKRGISAVEFAMLLPLMVTLYLGGVEVSQAVAVDRKVTLVARSLGDLVAQATNVTPIGQSPTSSRPRARSSSPYKTASSRSRCRA